jgi:hypothetical protein
MFDILIELIVSKYGLKDQFILQATKIIDLSKN